jgi:hypothetical protein
VILLLLSLVAQTPNIDRVVDREAIRQDLSRENLDGDLAVAADLGRAAFIRGKFDLGLRADTSRDRTRLAASVSRFIDRHPASYGTSKHVQLSTESVNDSNADFHRVSFSQRINGLPIWDSDLVALFSTDGNLVTLSGPVREPFTASEGPTALSDNDVINIISSEYSVVGEEREFTADESSVFRRNDGAWMARGIDPVTRHVAWRAWLPFGDFLVDEVMVFVFWVFL